MAFWIRPYGALLEWRTRVPSTHRRSRATAATVGAAAVVCVLSWLYRFNDPGGQFAGLTDDHFFYLVRGWQILYGDLPVRDFVDHGAPLFFYAGAAVQHWLGRGTLSEVTFCVTALSVAATLTFFAARTASGSIVLAGLATLVHVLLGPRFYNYPKVLVYAVAIPLLWRFIDRQDGVTRGALATTAVAAFLLRHDHGVFISLAFVVTLLIAQDLPWQSRVHHATRFAALALVLVAPYLLFVEFNGGLQQYFSDAGAWAARDRARAPVVWPGLFDNPDGVGPGQLSSNILWRAVTVIRDNFEAWVYYIEIIVPLFALSVVIVAQHAFRPGWPRSVQKIAVVAVLGIVLNAGFLRSPLEARLADPSVPHAILLAWLATVGVAQWQTGQRFGAFPRGSRFLRAATTLGVVIIGMVLVSVLSTDFAGRLARTGFIESADVNGHGEWRISNPVDRARDVARQLSTDWQSGNRFRGRDGSPLLGLARYLNTCSRPGDRILVQPYIPQVLALAERAFAGGHADLRPGFFDNVPAQRLTISRLQRQSVPLVLLEAGHSYLLFRESFPLIVSYLDANYHVVGTQTFDRLTLQLFVAKTAVPEGEFVRLGWPCFGERATAP